jgi:hypothetical protein
LKVSNDGALYMYSYFELFHCLNIKLQNFESWILLSSSGKKGETEQKSYLLGPPVELGSDLNEIRNFIFRQYTKSKR